MKKVKEQINSNFVHIPLFRSSHTSNTVGQINPNLKYIHCLDLLHLKKNVHLIMQVILQSPLQTTVQNAFLNKNGIVRYNFLVFGQKSTYFVKNDPKNKTCYIKEKAISLLEFGLDQSSCKCLLKTTKLQKLDHLILQIGYMMLFSMLQTVL